MAGKGKNPDAGIYTADKGGPPSPDEGAKPYTPAQRAAFMKEPLCTVYNDKSGFSASLDQRNGKHLADAPTLTKSWGTALTFKDPTDAGWTVTGDSVAPQSPINTPGLKHPGLQPETLGEFFSNRVKVDGFTVKVGDDGKPSCDVSTRDGKTYTNVPATIVTRNGP